jgi:hypothetical protein
VKRPPRHQQLPGDKEEVAEVELGVEEGPNLRGRRLLHLQSTGRTLTGAAPPRRRTIYGGICLMAVTSYRRLTVLAGLQA